MVWIKISKTNAVKECKSVLFCDINCKLQYVARVSGTYCKQGL